MKYSFVIVMALVAFFAACTTKQNSSFSPCREDFIKYCSEVEPGDGRVRDCMSAHQDKLSISCKEHSTKMNTEHDNTFMPTMIICHAEDEKFCSHIEKYAARRINCLKKVYKETPNQFSAECRESFSKIVNIIPPVYP